MSNMSNMSNELEKFIKDNREEFDDMPLPAGLWNKIEEQIQPPKKPVVVKMNWTKLAAAAAVIVAVGLITLKVLNNKTDVTQNNVAANNETKKTTEPAGTPVENTSTAINETDITGKQTPALTQRSNNNNVTNENNYNADAELFHFTKLVKIKLKQLLTIKDESPELYEHFAADYKKLDAYYNDLSEQLKTNPNKEILLEKMIANLQLQIGLLNEQLKVVRQLKNYKKDKANEIAKTM